MHCYICDREDDLINIEPRTQLSGPCTTCQAAINECLEGYESIEEPTFERHTQVDNAEL